MIDNSYEPSDEEKREIEDMLNKEDEKREHLEEFQERLKNRKFYTFNSESHFAGWLRTHGIIW